MSFSYDGLWKLLEQRKMSKEELRSKIGASQTTIVNMGKNKTVSLDVIDRICNVLNCIPNDIMSYFSDRESESSSIYPKRGEIYYVNLSTNGNDSTQKGSRPVVILQSDIFNKDCPTVLVAPITSNLNLNRNNLETIVYIDPDDTNNLPVKSGIMLDNISQIRKISLEVKIGYLKSNDMDRVNKKCLEILGLDCNCE